MVALTGEELRLAAKAHRRNTGKGVDVLGPDDVLDLPDEALTDLGVLFGLVEESWTWPWQLLLNVCHLAAKPNGGDRAIAAAAYLVRLWGDSQERSY